MKFFGVRSERKTLRRNRAAVRSTLLIFLFVFLTTLSRAAETNGFAVRFTSPDGKQSDVMVLPNLWLYVEAGQPATPFLRPGPFSAVFEGNIAGDLRASYFFKAEELGGSLKLEVNNVVVLDTSSAGSLSKAVQINKGPNPIKATFTSATKGDSFVRLGWTEKGTNANPIPDSWITHGRTPEVRGAELVYLGRELFFEYRCAKCHGGNWLETAPEVSMDGPAFEGIGARRNGEWMAKWIRDPKAARASVHMPKLLHGNRVKEDSEAIAAYLSTLQTEPAKPLAPAGAAFGQNAKALAEIQKRSGPEAKGSTQDGDERPADQNQERKPIFERLHCVGCHNAPGGVENDPAKISLQHVASKFADGKLAEFLKAPERYFTWIRMPNFKLADAEATELAKLLIKHADKPAAVAVAGKESADRGRDLVQRVGCLNCHSAGGLENKYVAPALAKIADEFRGCLAEKHTAESKAPDFGLSAGERAALSAFLKTDRTSLSRHSPIEFASRQTRLLNCNACHGQIELVPPLEVLGGKLKPEWAAAFLGGQPFKVRADKHPKGELWIEARMPSFASRARWIAEGMAMQQGYAPRTADEGSIDEEAAKIGHKMVGKDNGLSCISCHAVNDLSALEVFESEGLNLGLGAHRLLKPYFFRWMRSPLAVDPQTKMPAYFEDGKSALTDYYEGDGEKQINALYQYIRLAEKMPAPNTGQ
jgi:cytochrome c551/c552